MSTKQKFEPQEEHRRPFRDRKEHRAEVKYKHERAIPYKREPIIVEKLLEEDDE